MKLGDPNPETVYDFYKWVARKRRMPIGDVYRRFKGPLTSEGMNDSLNYHYRSLEIRVHRDNPFFAMVPKR